MYKYASQSVLIEFWIVVARGNKAKSPEFKNHGVQHHRIDSMVQCANHSPKQAFVVNNLTFLSSASRMINPEF